MISKTLLHNIHLLQLKPTDQFVFVGFDGYVDFIQKAVKFNDGSNKTYFHSLNDIGKHIALAAGKSAQIELTTFVKKLGGNAPIMANALATLGAKVSCAGSLGYPVVHDLFSSMHQNCSLLSFAEPGITNALEFEDGKLILSELSAFEQLDFNFIQQRMGAAYLDAALKKSKLIALVDWTNLPLGTSLWKGIFEHLRTLHVKDKIFFFDLCDPAKKSPLEIQEILQVISRFKSMGLCILGMNENEAWKVFYALQGVSYSGGDEIETLRNHSLQQVAEYIYNAITVDAVLVHPVDRCVVVTADKTLTQTGRIISHPALLTGGGDNLNAGFCYALLNGFDWNDCMQFGMAVSGSYVQHGFSPAISGVISFLEAE
jgi:sugar/nucleoside kinase (ribokinase family)